MKEVGVRALKQNASAVVAEAAAGEVITITDRGRPVAQLVPLESGRLRSLTTAGRARVARRSLRELGKPTKRAAKGKSAATVLEGMRRDERY
jgi:prevent-host-death family protein